MPAGLKWHTIPETLAGILIKLSGIRELSAFRLVGGTSLSLQFGHRASSDIDMFSDEEYGSVDFQQIDSILRKSFGYVSEDPSGVFSFGLTRMIGESGSDPVKVDLFHTDPFIRQAIEMDGIKLASPEDIAAMKLEIISRDGRKRDFWDIHELLDTYELAELLNFYRERNPYQDIAEVISGLGNYLRADQEMDPVCLKGKFWDLIRYDIEEAVRRFTSSG